MNKLSTLPNTQISTLLSKYQDYDPSPNLNRMTPIPSQMLTVSYKSSSLDITLDTGANVSYIRLSEAQQLGLDIMPNNQLALLADMQTRMASLGEVNFIVQVQNIVLRIRALIMKNLQAACFGGTTFHADNDITARVKTGEILIHNKFLIKQSNPFTEFPFFPPPFQKSNSISTPGSQVLPECLNNSSTEALQPPLATPTLLKFNAVSVPSTSVTFSGEIFPIPLPSHLTHLGYIGIVPNFPSIPEKVTDSLHWLPQVCEVRHGQALYKNISRDPIIAPKYSHFKTLPVDDLELSDVTSPVEKKDRYKPMVELVKLNGGKVHHSLVPAKTLELMSTIQINRSVLSTDQEERLNRIHKVNHKVFDNNLIEGYNHRAGEFFANFTFTNKPPPTRLFVPQFNKRCATIQQAKCDELESQGVLVDPKVHGIPVLHVSPSWIQQKSRAKHKDLESCTLDELRFITAFNSLNDCIRPQPSSSCSSSAIFTFLARWTCHIYADLNNSYFQLPVQKSLWCYLGIMTPHKGIRVMTRTGQGLLGSDVELEELMSRILGDDIDAGHCIAIRDDIIIGGNTIDEAISNYEKVLFKLDNNNLKLSPNKVRIFPADTEIYGYRVKDGCIEPSSHIITSLGQTSMESLTTVKKVNSWKGLYKCLIGHLPALAMVMSPFDSATGGKSSAETFSWTPQLVAAFNEAISHLKQINKTYLPAPNEQLVLLPDTMSVSPCTGWVLYTQRDQKLLPVTFCSAKLKEYMVRWFPCEKEAVGTVLAIEHCAHWISESELTTLVGPDSSAVVQAANLMRKGKYSSNPRLQSLLASVNRRNVKFFHNSAKSGKHIVPDCLSRLKDTTCKSKDCAVERFLDDIPINLEAMALTLLSISLEQSAHPAIIAATSAELSELLTQTAGPIPLGSRQTWINIQKSDPDCVAVFNQKSSGDVPRKNSTNTNINKIFKEAIIHQGLLVLREFDDKKMKEVDKVVVPPTYLDSVCTVLHIKLNHPTQYQLKQVFERHFFCPKLDLALQKLYEACLLCISFKKFPKELESFSPTLFPDHPGTHMNVDIMKRSGQLVLVNIDLFSGLITCSFAISEKAEDLSKAIINAVTPIRHADVVQVRVDKAPALLSLASNQTSDLSQLGIKLNLPLDDNKNSNCCVDKAIAELEIELRKLSPSGAQISALEISKASTLLNNKVRNRGLTAAEIHFSRDSNDHQNLNLDDSRLQSEVISKRNHNHAHSAKSKAPSGKPQHSPELSRGDIVYVKTHGSKHETRDPHIVVETSDQSATLRKAMHFSPQDVRPVKMAPKDRIVATKFIYRPKHQSTRSSPDFQLPRNDDVQDDEELICIPVGPPWQPIDGDSVVIPHLCDVDIGSEALDLIQQILVGDQQEEQVRIDDEPDASSTSLDTSENDDCAEADVPVANDEPGENDVDSDSETDNDNLEVILFENGQGLFQDENLIQNRILKKKDRAAFFDQNLGRWRKVTITSNVVKRKGWEHWHNFVDDDGIAGGIYFIPDERWSLLDDSDSEAEPDAVPGVIHQLDGLAIPDSATPETSPEKEDILQQFPTILVGTKPKIRLHTTEYLSDTSDDNVDSNINLDEALHVTPDWDNFGTDLECSVAQDTPASYRSVPLDQVVNLDHILPLTSTPVPTPSPGRLRSRISAMRRQLPMEYDKKESSFLSRLNPFRKR